MKNLVLLLMIFLIACENLDVLNQPPSGGLEEAVLALVSTRPPETNAETVQGTNYVSAVSPVNNSIVTNSTTTVTVTFTQDMDQTATQSAITVKDANNTVISGTFNWTNSKTVVFTPTSLTAYTIHTITINSNAKTLSGLSQSTIVSSNFRIGPFVQSNGLYWTSGTVVGYTYPNAVTYCSNLGMRIPTVSEISAVSGNKSIFTTQSIYWTTDVSIGTDGQGNVCAPPETPCSSLTNWQTGKYNRSVRAGYNSPAGICDGIAPNLNGLIVCKRNDGGSDGQVGNQSALRCVF